MGSLGRSLLALVVVAAIVGLIGLARGEPGHGEPDPPPAAAAGAFPG